MDVYLAEKDNMRFYIQPDKLEIYANAGYTIYRMEEVEVTDVKAEMLKAEPMTYFVGAKEEEHD